MLWNRALAPGAENLLPKIMSDPAMHASFGNPSRAVNDLTIEEWAVITRVFSAWPFKPKVSRLPLLSCLVKSRVRIQFIEIIFGAQVLFDDGGFTSTREY